MSATMHSAPVVSGIDPFSVAFCANLHTFQAQLRDAGPVVWLEKYGVWGMARYAEVHGALNNWQTFISAAGAGIHDLRKEKAWRPPSIVLEADPPLHDVTRGAMNRVLSGPAIRRLRGDFQAEAERLVEELVSRGEFDAVKDLAIPYPLKVVGDAVGVPPEGRECLLPFSNMLFNSFGPENEIFRQSIIESGRVVKALFTQCDRDSLTADGLGMQFYRAADEGRFPAEYAPVLVRSILSAGFDTTVSGFSNAIYGFATNPEQWQILRENPPLLRSAFDEIIRWESPVQTFFRTTSKEIEIAGVRIVPNRRSSCSSPPPTGIRGAGKKQMSLTFAAIPPVTWRLAAAFTSASARCWLGSRPNCCSRPLPGAWRASNSRANPCTAQTIRCAVLRRYRSGFGVRASDVCGPPRKASDDPACRGGPSLSCSTNAPIDAASFASSRR
jgi:4-methoxybenzoate monooxygenase (O-demethylating)